jgi:hypothetical protein
MRKAYILVQLGLNEKAQITINRVGVYSERWITMDQRLLLLELGYAEAPTFEGAYNRAVDILVAYRSVSCWSILLQCMDSKLREDVIARISDSNPGLV